MRQTALCVASSARTSRTRRPSSSAASPSACRNKTLMGWEVAFYRTASRTFVHLRFTPLGKTAAEKVGIKLQIANISAWHVDADSLIIQLLMPAPFDFGSYSATCVDDRSGFKDVSSTS
mmetsp:Transcript_31994/g.110595  ORF Transcript_31994/g.110595 Transcript_31994/m.110595 type:complete len:119 (+) Transcript_31994:270-626(+)